MKKLMTYFMVLLASISMLTAEEFTTGGIYVNSASENISCNLLTQTTNLMQQIIVGKTYRLETEVMEFKTKVGEELSLSFSTGLQVGVLPKSTFSVDSFNQLVKNDASQPAALRAEYSITTLSLLEGEVNLICPKMDTNSHCILQTPLVNVNLAAGRLSVRANPKWVILDAIDGPVTVVDAKDKKYVIDKGKRGIITPYPGRDNQIMVNPSMEIPDFDKVTESLNTLERNGKDVLFIVLDKKIVGVRLK